MQPSTFLTPKHKDDLSFFFNEFPAIAGLKSSFGDIVMQSIYPPGTKGGTRSHSNQDDGLDRASEVVDAGHTSRANVVRRALEWMIASGHSLETVVLYRMFGPQYPAAPADIFGDVAQIVSYTPTVLAMAEEMAAAEANIREAKTRANAVEEAQDVADQLSQVFWEAVCLREKLAEKIAKRTKLVGVLASTDDGIARMVAERDAWWKTMGSIAGRIARDIETGAAHTARASAALELGRGDALRSVLQKENNVSLVADIRRDAERLRIRAGQLFIAALKATS